MFCFVVVFVVPLLLLFLFCFCLSGCFSKTTARNCHCFLTALGDLENGHLTAICRNFHHNQCENTQLASGSSSGSWDDRIVKQVTTTPGNSLQRVKDMECRQRVRQVHQRVRQQIQTPEPRCETSITEHLETPRGVHRPLCTRGVTYCEGDRRRQQLARAWQL